MQADQKGVDEREKTSGFSFVCGDYVPAPPPVIVVVVVVVKAFVE